MNITILQLQTIMPFAKARAFLFLEPLNAAMVEFEINTPLRQAAFLAQIGHESGQLTRLEEGLNYSADGLMSTWPSRFTSMAQALTYARQPQKIANYVYANRNGNGNEASGDGWLYRGSGAIELTFHDNHAACAAYFGIPLDDVGDWLRSPTGACRSAGWFWSINEINEFTDKGDFDGVSDKVNKGRKTTPIGDSIGYADRLALYNKAKKVLI